jgi:hypothetical protein
MSRLTLETCTLPAARLGGENPLAPLRAYETASAAATADPAAGNSAAGNSAAGDPETGDPDQLNSILPYRLQDQYDRALAPREFKTAVLENQHLRATFLLELGGRLASLIHKSSGRELLFRNPVFQPANLAVRDAWFSGGVEWNVSIIGHSPFTCSPVFAARVAGDDDVPVLRLYEWDRIRRVPFQIDCWLAHESPFLMVRVRIVNPNEDAVAMYWWSNIGVVERADVRVLAPSDQAFRHDYDGRLVAHDVPLYEDTDVTYTTNRPSAADLYFRIPQGHRPWIAALDARGSGLVHTSTDQLFGRKMFNWGTDSGGRRWQEFLARPGEAYLEIQGGLATTQSEYVSMPAGAEWCWLEAYGLIEADPAEVHSADWNAAHAAVERVLERRLPRASLDAELDRTRAMADRAPAELLHRGSGWGALELRRRARAGQGPFASPAIPFPDDSLGPAQAPWLALLERGALPERPAAQEPGSLLVQPEWRALLERSVADGRAGDWMSWYHLGVMRYRAGDSVGAKAAWEHSLRENPSPWAKRDLAVLARERGDERAASDLWLDAARAAPDLAPLAIECAGALLRAGRAADAIAFIASVPEPVRAHGRIRLARATAALAQGDLENVERYFNSDLDIANIREKETTLSDLWFGWQEQKLSRQRGVAIDGALRQEVRRNFPPPLKFDFRLNVLIE